MKVLIVGSDKIYAIENLFAKYLKEEGLQVYLFAAQGLFYNYYYKTFFNKIIYRLGLSAIINKINILLLEKISDIKPDIIWVFKGMEIYPKTLRQIRKNNVKLINYNPDNPFIFSGKGSGNRNITNSISLYDFHFTYNLEIKKKLDEIYKLSAYWLPFGFDVTETVYNIASLEKEVVKTSFVGNPDKNRAKFIIQLADKGVEIDLFGHDWDNFINHQNITTYPAVFKNELWVALRKYRVQLNPLRIHNLDSHCMRSFEVPAIGGIMLAPRTIEHVQFFEEGKEAFFYDNVEDAVSKVHYLLSLPQEKANQIREAARKRSLQSGYSYKDRTAQVLNIFNSIEA